MLVEVKENRTSASQMSLPSTIRSKVWHFAQLCSSDLCVNTAAKEVMRDHVARQGKSALVRTLAIFQRGGRSGIADAGDLLILYVNSSTTSTQHKSIEESQAQKEEKIRAPNRILSLHSREARKLHHSSTALSSIGFPRVHMDM
ncbi:hypothetical protein ACTXT7_012433 [Hymenolepis weldensis]